MIDPTEKVLTGKWEVINGIPVADQVCERIYDLISKQLHEIARSSDGWSILYIDPSDGRLWELTYPQSHMQGGGPPALSWVTEEEAKKKYPQIEPDKSSEK